MTRFIGIDGCKKGWFFVCLDQNRCCEWGILETICALSSLSTEDDVILIDIPIGLKEIDTRERQCDRLARKLLKKRASSIFPAPSRLAMKAPDYKTASGLNFKYTGRKLSKQSYFIMPKIDQVDQFIRQTGKGFNIREYHPELCFLALNRFAPLLYSKKQKLGQKERVDILARYLESAQDIIAEAGKNVLKKDVATDDIIDALAGAVTAEFNHRVVSLPDPPEMDNKGIPMAITYPRVPGDREPGAKTLRASVVNSRRH